MRREHGRYSLSWLSHTTRWLLDFVRALTDNERCTQSTTRAGKKCTLATHANSVRGQIVPVGTVPVHAVNSLWVGMFELVG
jgi:hypothetical protein